MLSFNLDLSKILSFGQELSATGEEFDQWNIQVFQYDGQQLHHIEHVWTPLSLIMDTICFICNKW